VTHVRVLSPVGPGATSVALEVSGLQHRFGKKTVLHTIDFTIAPGDFTVLLGPNGAGKTTLFALITRLYHAHEGRIAVFGQAFKANPSAALAQIGVVFQQPTLDLDLTVQQNLLYHAALHGMPRRHALARTLTELERVNLLERRHDRVRALSGGQRRRVELARALLHDPALLLLDEPTAGLDIESRAFLLAHVRALCAERGMAVLWATHLIDEVGEGARVIVLHRGRILANGPAADVVLQQGSASLEEAFGQLVHGGPA
jgi:ABC-2 type transport system ATP-binding protein